MLLVCYVTLAHAAIAGVRSVRTCKRASWSTVVAQLLLSTMLRRLIAVAAALGAVALLPPTHARPPRRLQSAVATPELTKDEAGHLLGSVIHRTSPRRCNRSMLPAPRGRTRSRQMIYKN